ncbi:AGL132Cp [Eremothecium gossypii ATCC 10895]|uniref:AGL132Cp n=1 Tax=Eremothecium gossypii (strain ATCC 10895 / CBS 109.51 / FGSC 9923 / NRRL Y-1056) TaxID=284811 RepID=Q750S1_EREGS|nr:AGL132Cp [Eremothecium gossypii ATCC 10895]AAS54359.2 AGL132Cp [Eremothecium gossypii ATCC 10895]AEY98686.1 FAGL132Cp [Eremothecium gossypii FDAG1]
MAGNGRVLRSNLKARKSGGDDDERFNFDTVEHEIDPYVPLRIVQTARAPLLDLDLESGATRAQIRNMLLEVEARTLGDGGRSHIEDDDVYESYHRKMFKQETRMINDDKVESENGAERLQHISEALELPGWEQVLQQITVIGDASDAKELESKRKKTQIAIADMLTKFRDMKRRINVHSRNYRHAMCNVMSNPSLLYRKVDRTMVLGYTSSSDEEEEDMDIEQIRRRRRLQREKKFAGSLVIQLTNTTKMNARYAIVAEPLRAPYVIKYTREERNHYRKLLQDGPARFTFLTPLEDQVAIFKCRKMIPLTLDPVALRPVNDSESDVAHCKSLSTLDQIRRFRVMESNSIDATVTCHTVASPSANTVENKPSSSSLLPHKRSLSPKSSSRLDKRRQLAGLQEFSATAAVSAPDDKLS